MKRIRWNVKKWNAKTLYDTRQWGMELQVIWLGFTAALGFWIASSLAALGWVLIQGAGTYWLGVYVYLFGLLGVFLGGLLAGRRAEARGWLHGLWVGIFLGLFGVIFNLELVPRLASWGSILRQLLVWALWGLTGGYLGHYLKLQSKYKRRVRGR